jgi:hypothetical protein
VAVVWARCVVALVFIAVTDLDAPGASNALQPPHLDLCTERCLASAGFGLADILEISRLVPVRGGY